MVSIYNLVTKAMNGDEEALNELIPSIKKYLLSIARNKLINDTDIEDAVQTAIDIICLNIQKIDSPYSFWSWTTTIFYNVCNDICRKDIYQKKVVEKLTKNSSREEYELDIDEFENLIEPLDDKGKNVLELFYNKDLSSKTIAEKLNMTDGNIRNILSTSRSKLKAILRKRLLPIFIFCLLVAGVAVAATCLINYLKEAFSTKSVGLDNDEVLMAIENLDWYQEVDMGYIPLGDGYEIKVDYLSMDEMSLYMIVNLRSENELNAFNNISLPDLEITDENNNVICNASNILSTQFTKVFANKLIEHDSHNIKILVFMYTNEFPNSKKLNVNFSKTILYKYNSHETSEKAINANVEFSIDLTEKFISRSPAHYYSSNTMLKKCIISETGFHAIIENNNSKIFDIFLMDENGNKYKCYMHAITSKEHFEYIIFSSFNDISSKSLKLVLPKEVIELTKIQ